MQWRPECALYPVEKQRSGSPPRQMPSLRHRRSLEVTDARGGGQDSGRTKFIEVLYELLLQKRRRLRFMVDPYGGDTSFVKSCEFGPGRRSHCWNLKRSPD